MDTVGRSATCLLYVRGILSLYNLLPLPNPHTSTSPIPFVAVPDIRISLGITAFSEVFRLTGLEGNSYISPTIAPFQLSIAASPICQG